MGASYEIQPQIWKTGHVNSRTLPVSIISCFLVAGCLNTQSVAFRQPAESEASPKAACRIAAQSDGWTVLDVHSIDEVTEGYWEARVEVNDPELQDLVLCRHNTVEGWTEILVLDD